MTRSQWSSKTGGQYQCPSRGIRACAMALPRNDSTGILSVEEKVYTGPPLMKMSAWRI